MSDTVIENLVTRFGFDVDQKKLDQINTGITNIVKGLSSAIKVASVAVAATAAAATGVFLFAKKIAEANDKLGKFAETLGLDVESLQELGYAAELNGGSVESMNSSLSSLTKMMSEASRGIGSGVEAFGLLGLSVTDAQGKIKNTDEFLYEISDALANLGTQAEKIELAGKLGIDKNLILTLDKGSAALKNQRNEARELGFVIDKNAAGSAANFNDALLKTNKIISGVTNSIGQGLMKEITPMLNAFVKWFKANKELIKQNIVDFVTKIGQAFRIIVNLGMRFAGIIEGITKLVGGLENAIALLGIAFLALNIKALMLPLLFTALGLALFIILDDIKTFASGGTSALGDMVDSINEKVTGLKNTIKKELPYIYPKIKSYLSGGGGVVKRGAFGEEQGIFNKTIPKTAVERDYDQQSLISQYPNAKINDQGIIILPPVGGQQVSKTTNNNSNIIINITGVENKEQIRQTAHQIFSNYLNNAQNNLKSNIER